MSSLATFELGVETQHEKERVVAQRTTFLGVVWDSITMRAQLSHNRIESILAMVSRIKLGHTITLKQFQRLLGLMAAASNVIFFGLLYMRPLQSFPREETLSFDQGHMPMPSCPVHMEETLVSVPRPSIGSVMPPKNRFHRLIPYGLGHGHGWPLCERSVAGPAFLMAHNLSGNARGLQGSEELSPRSQRSPCPIRSDNMSVVSYLNHQGGSEVTPSVQTGAPDPPVVQGETVVSQNDVCPRGP